MHRLNFGKLITHTQHIQTGDISSHRKIKFFQFSFTFSERKLSNTRKSEIFVNFRLPGDKFHIKVLEMATIKVQTNGKDKVDKCGPSVFSLFSR